MYMPKEKDTLKIIFYLIEQRGHDLANSYDDIEEFIKENALKP